MIFPVILVSLKNHLCIHVPQKQDVLLACYDQLYALYNLALDGSILSASFFSVFLLLHLDFTVKKHGKSLYSGLLIPFTQVRPDCPVANI